MAGSFRSVRRNRPSSNSGSETSRALVAAVPLQELMRMDFDRPLAKDLMFKMEVAPVSSRKRMRAPSIWTC